MRAKSLNSVIPLVTAVGGMLSTCLTNAATLELGGALPLNNSTASFPVGLSGSVAVVAMQFDVSYPAARLTLSAPVFNAAVPKHQLVYRELAPGLTRMVVYATPNTALPTSLILDLPVSLPTGNQAEDLVVSISNIWFADASGRMIPASAGYGPVSKWKRLVFTPQELNNPAVSGDASDPEDDGLPNLVELLLRGRVKAQDFSRRPQQALMTGNDGKLYLSLTYRQSKVARGVEGEVQGSTDLLDWSQVVPAAATGNQDAETVEMRANILIDGQSRQFLRLRAKRVPVP